MLGALLGARIDRVTLRKVDLVSESTVCDVRFTLPSAGRPVDSSPDARMGSAARETAAFATSASLR